ncbi:MAG: nuclear transport factor 2 family protein [Actinomycetota bacterium]
MDPELVKLLDERECERLISTYCHLVDFGNAPDIANLFTPNGVWLGLNVKMNGQEDIRAHFEHRQSVTRRQSRHLCTNIVIDMGIDKASAICYLVNYRHDSSTGEAESPAPVGLPKYVGEYHDTFEKTSGGWRFAVRRFEIAFLRPATVG